MVINRGYHQSYDSDASKGDKSHVSSMIVQPMLIVFSKPDGNDSNINQYSPTKEVGKFMTVKHWVLIIFVWVWYILQS